MFSGVQEQLQMRGGQEEPDCLQGLPSPQMSHGRHVQVGLKVIYVQEQIHGFINLETRI